MNRISMPPWMRLQFFLAAVWLVVSAALLPVFFSCVRLFIVENRTPIRAFQACGALIQLVNGLVAALSELRTCMPKAACKTRSRHMHLSQLAILNVMRAVNQATYSYHPLVEMAGPMCQLPQVPKLSPLSSQLNAVASNLVLESSTSVLFLMNLCDLPVYLFLDYRYASLNGLLPTTSLHLAVVGALKRALLLAGMKIGVMDNPHLISETLPLISSLLTNNNNAGSILFLPVIQNPSRVSAANRVVIFTLSALFVFFECVEVVVSTVKGSPKQFSALEVVTWSWVTYAMVAITLSSQEQDAVQLILDQAEVSALSSQEESSEKDQDTTDDSPHHLPFKGGIIDSQAAIFSFGTSTSPVQPQDDLPTIVKGIVNEPSLSACDVLPSSERSQKALMEEVMEVAEQVVERGGKDGGGDRLELLHSIGGGAHGTVFKGRWRNMDVAVKTVLFPFEHGQSSGDAKKRAILEAGVSCSVCHPNVVSTFYYDIKAVDSLLSGSSPRSPSNIPGGLDLDFSSSSHDCHDWRLFLVQELCSASLDEMLAEGLLHTTEKGRGFVKDRVDGIYNTKQGERTMADLSRLYGCLLDVARGMEYLHERGVIHGDLKPENILIKEDLQNPQGFMFKITDFGLSAMMDPKKTHISNFRHGTPFYVAPEILSGKMTSLASDVFSFGILMTELYTGNPPWLYEEGCLILNPRFVAQLEEDAPPAYVEIVHCCLNLDPKARPSFQHIRISLQEMLNQEVKRKAVNK